MKIFQLKTFASSIIFLSALLLNTSAFAIADAGTMLQNFTETVPQLMRLVTAFAYVMGMFFIFKGIAELKQLGESRTMMSREHSINGPLILIVIGTVLLYLPSSVQVATSTFWATTVPYAYIPKATDEWSVIINDGYLIIQLIGTIAFIRGVAMLSSAAQRGGQASLGKALSHIIAGTLCINLEIFLNTINNTLSLGQS
ncbi:MAG: hypothetical protein P4M14_07855 [Gammaproteobacteria bacterium]|nr:hypothetical protein [Gammaproteobacteria bacterium]